jgi:hypothetical protein
MTGREECEFGDVTRAALRGRWRAAVGAAARGGALGAAACGGAAAAAAAAALRGFVGLTGVRL